jgi:fructokinase
LVKNANSTWLIGQRLDHDLAHALDRPVRLENDANCFALSEAADGAGAGAHVVFGVILGTGCGGGIVVDGRLLVGRNAIAGEWGHNPLPAAEADDLPLRPCYCGRSGCIETYLCGPALERDHGTGADAAAIENLALQGDARARAALDRHARRLARALASIVNILDPDVIVLGGGLSNLRRLYEVLPDLMRPHIFSDRVDIDIRPPAHGDSSGVRGAAWLWPAIPE